MTEWATDWVGRLIMALGFFGMSAHEESVQDRGPKWRSVGLYVAGVSAGLLGLGILFAPFHRPTSVVSLAILRR